MNDSIFVEAWGTASICITLHFIHNYRLLWGMRRQIGINYQLISTNEKPANDVRKLIKDRVFRRNWLFLPFIFNFTVIFLGIFLSSGIATSTSLASAFALFLVVIYSIVTIVTLCFSLATEMLLTNLENICLKI